MTAIRSAATTRLSDEARHSAKCHEILTKLGATPRPSRCRRHDYRSPFRTSQQDRQSLNVFCGSAAYFRRPLRRFRHTVISTENVVLVIVFRIGSLRHMVCVETDSAALEKIPIDKRIGRGVVLRNKHIGHTQEHSAVRTRPNRNVIIRQRTRRGRIEWIDANKLHSCVSTLQVLVIGQPRTTPSRIRCPEHDDIARSHIHTIILLFRHANKLCHLRPCPR